MDFYEKYLESAYRFLTIRNRSEKEVRDNLKKKKAEPEVIDKIIQRLTEQKFLNDQHFAQWWVRQRSRFKPRGKPMLRLELQQKGIARHIIDQVLSEPDDEVDDEMTQIKRLVEKRFEKMKDLPKQEIYDKLGSFLMRKGFSFGLIRRAIDDRIKNAYNTDEE